MSNPVVETVFVGPSPRIALDVAGDGDLVVFLHGIGGNRANWRDTLPAVAARWRAAAWDARGYGDSEDYDGPLDFHAFADDLARVLDHFGADRAHIVGLSMGGRIAADFHGRHPGRVRSLTLCDTHLGFAHMTPAARADFVRLRREPLLAGKEPRDIAPAVADSLIGDRANADAYAQLMASLSKLHKESYLKTIEASVGMDHADLYAGVDKPTLVIVGALDRLTPPAMAREIVDRIPGARLCVIEGAGHLSNIEQPEAFNRALLDFLAAVH
ncbi:alpha/beta fold hydrolase [Rubrimonas sp.]|uniref:alpha/beta fold hydrolase n=1 Tax=Rubrimonas sp. TaxID=2036015 RepID=UPI002FDDBC31